MSREPAATDTKKVEPKPEPKLARASASGDAAVQQLLAVRQIHLDNDDGAKVADVDARLAELGFTAQ